MPSPRPSSRSSEGAAAVRRALTATTLYGALGITPSASASLRELGLARRAAMLLTHPDRWVADTPEAQRLAHDASARLNAAYETLADSRRRKLYDASLRATHTQCATCKGTGAHRQQKGFNGVVFSRCAACNGEGWVPR